MTAYTALFMDLIYPIDRLWSLMPLNVVVWLQASLKFLFIQIALNWSSKLHSHHIYCTVSLVDTFTCFMLRMVLNDMIDASASQGHDAGIVILQRLACLPSKTVPAYVEVQM